MIIGEIKRLKIKLVQEKDMQNISVCCIEEISEVTKVLTKYLRGSSKFNEDILVEEVAHALLMLDVIKIAFNLDDKEVALEQLRALEKALPKKDD
jgi:hypothetical protein